jgi:hypothetical protein
MAWCLGREDTLVGALLFVPAGGSSLELDLCI